MGPMGDFSSSKSNLLGSRSLPDEVEGKGLCLIPAGDAGCLSEVAKSTPRQAGNRPRLKNDTFDQN